MKRRLQNNIFLVASAIVHVIVCLVLMLQWQLQIETTALGGTKTPIVSSYVYQDRSVSISSTKVASRQENATSPKHKQALALKAVKQTNTSPQDRAAIASRKSSGNGEPVPELVALLHAAIQKQQQYPATALALEREGRITLMFTLFTSGKIDHLRILKSSGTPVLDAAALAAVTHAAPFQGVGRFLQEQQDYQIDVVFEVT